MISAAEIEALGDPSITLGGLRIWIHGRQFPQLQDFWDGNWLHASAFCEASGASVYVNGTFLHLSELETWRSLVDNMDRTLMGEATLPTLEPTLKVKLKIRIGGHVSADISITPDHLKQSHQFQFDFDQTYLGPLHRGLGMVLAEYPLRGLDASGKPLST